MKDRSDSEILLHGKLTKKFFLSLDEGVYLVSGIATEECMPEFRENVTSSGGAREMQWEKIKQANCDQRNCFVFRDRSHFQRWLSHIKLK